MCQNDGLFRASKIIYSNSGLQHTLIAATDDGLVLIAGTKFQNKWPQKILGAGS